MSIGQCYVSVRVHYCLCVSGRNSKIVPDLEIIERASENKDLP